MKRLFGVVMALVISSTAFGVVTRVGIPKSVQLGYSIPVIVEGYRSDSCEMPYIHGSIEGNTLTVQVDTYYIFFKDCLQIVYPFEETVYFEGLDVGKYDVLVIDHDTLVFKRSVKVKD